MASLFGDFNITEAMTEVKDAIIVLIPLVFILLVVYVFRDTLKGFLTGITKGLRP